MESRMNRHQEESAAPWGQFWSCPAGLLCRKKKASLCFSASYVWVLQQATEPHFLRGQSPSPPVQTASPFSAGCLYSRRRACGLTDLRVQHRCRR